MEDGNGKPELLPARMLNEFAYCPRLFYIEHVEGLFQHNLDTVQGTSVHRRVDRTEGAIPESASEEPPRVARSVTLSSEELGFIAKIDLVETEGDVAIPVDTKKGRAPNVPDGAWEPERVQLCVQGLLLREHGFRCDYGYLYFAGSRTRVRIDFTETLIARTLDLAKQAVAARADSKRPPPLVDSPKCPRCSLVGICLPDEVNFLEKSSTIRRLTPERDERVGVYVQGHGIYVGKRGECLKLEARDGTPPREVPIREVAHVAIYGNNQVSTQALQTLAGKGVPVSWFSHGGWFYGTFHGLGLPNVLMRQQQFRTADDPVQSLRLARGFVAGKVRNSRTFLMRNHPDLSQQVTDALRQHAELAEVATSAETLLGIEGNAARHYFANFSGMLKPRVAYPEESWFSFESRNRRPPRDPVNSMLSFAYSLLCREFHAVLTAVGFDPYVGFYHRPRPGRPALALDLMEEFRPIVADSVVLTVVNNGEAAPEDFVITRAGCTMKKEMRGRFIRAYERRMDDLVTHPVFGYRVSYRRVLEIQARLVGRLLMGEITEYPAFTTR